MPIHKGKETLILFFSIFLPSKKRHILFLWTDINNYVLVANEPISLGFCQNAATTCCRSGRSDHHPSCIRHEYTVTLSYEDLQSIFSQTLLPVLGIWKGKIKFNLTINILSSLLITLKSTKEKEAIRIIFFFFF